jgi:hypothetical protein
MRKKKIVSKKTKPQDINKISLTWGSCLKFWLIGFALFIVFAMLWVGFSLLTK